jgi:excisionase family DNA binding protein
MSQDNEKRMISTPAMCRRLGVCRQTLYKWVERGILDATRTPGNHYRFESDAKPQRQRAA